MTDSRFVVSWGWEKGGQGEGDGRWQLQGVAFLGGDGKCPVLASDGGHVCERAALLTLRGRTV